MDQCKASALCQGISLEGVFLIRNNSSIAHDFPKVNAIALQKTDTPRRNGRGFFLHPVRLPVLALPERVEAHCPEALHPFFEGPVSVCPAVRSNALCKMFRFLTRLRT